jgi:hypothetical protein
MAALLRSISFSTVFLKAKCTASMAVSLLDAGGMGPIGVFPGRKFTNLHSLEKLGNVPSVPGFPEKQDSLSLRIAPLGGAAV